MKRIALSGVILLVLSGCRAPMPSFNPLAPLGNTRVPPPATGTIGTGQNYYTPPATTTTPPAARTGFRATPNKWSNLEDPNKTPAATTAEWSPDRTDLKTARVVNIDDLDVALASHETPSRVRPTAPVVEYQGPIRIVQSNSTVNPSRPALRGMPVSSASNNSAPRAFVPSGRVVELPASATTDSSHSDSSTTPRTRGSSEKGSGGGAAGGWQSRT